MIEQSYISPFMTSIQNVFSTMLQLPVETGEPVIKAHESPTDDISGVITMFGDLEGVVSLNMPVETAVSIINLFTGERLDPTMPEFADALGELVNMITGNAKAEFQLNNVSISCPQVIVGEHLHITRPKGALCVCVPCTTDCGVISLEISICELNESSTDTDNIAA